MAWLASAALLVFVGNAQADDDGASSSNKITGIVTLGANLNYGASYPGAAHNNLSAMPSFDWRRMGEPEEYSPADDNFDFSLFDWRGFSIGPVVSLRDSRSARDSESLKGLKEIKNGFDAGIFANYWFIPNVWRARVEVRQAISNGTGLEVDLGTDYFTTAGDKWVFSLGPRLSFADGTYMRSYFGVSQSESAASGQLAAFTPDAGLQSVGVAASASYKISSDWTVQFYGRLDRLVGDAADSPITQAGSANQMSFGIGLTKAFQISF
ncbi:MipA/OmpV family protein [Rhizobium paknamense]|uniref:Outer membrane scaffolding protein for murein synthesis (MipA/OmpV family) n=1 Tax=Rhizobium paknamense TaxID=1206817 RepID=A0ABU0IDM8_9HYPH|nr:MipA/OmpV family protein [Rhizobium paknamense]MDQ0455738.1 outer membrane scaffolding protein for murein synthesis (MipA/OmpV family) [Rhizobium paknamense]